MHTDLVVTKNDKILDKVFVVTMLQSIQQGDKSPVGPLALEKLNKCVEKKNVDYDTKRNSTFLKETQEIKIKEQARF